MNIQDVISKDLQNGERAGQASRPRKRNEDIRKRFHYEADSEQASAEQNAASLALAQQNSSSYDSQYNLRSKRIKQIQKPATSPRRSRRELEPPYECTRDEVFQMGSQVQQAIMLKTLQEHQCQHLQKSGAVSNLENESVIEENEEEDGEVEEIANIAEHRSEYVASQVATIYELCDRQSDLHPAAAAKIQRFALALARQLPEKEAKAEIPIDEAELDPTFIEIAKKMSRALPFEIDDAAIIKLAKQLQAKADTANVEKEDSGENEGKKFDISDQEKHVGRILGNLMLIAQDQIVLAAKLVSSRNIEESEARVLAEASKIIVAAKERIDAHAAIHQATILQHIDLAHFQKLTLEIARLLILKPGYLNVGIIDDTLNNLIPEKFKGTLIVQNMSYILNQLKNDPLLWLLISEIEPPESPQLPSNELIRATLGLGAKEPITKLHAQVTILSAIIRPIRQAKSGTCFATSWLIKTTYNDLKSCIEDYSEAIKYGETKRLIHHEYRTFTFQTRTSKEALDTILEASPDGSIIRVNRYEGTAYDKLHKDPHPAFGAKLYDAPGIRQACQALDISPVEAVIQSLAVLNGKPFSIEQFLTELAKYAEAKQHAVPYRLRSVSQNTHQELVDKALYAFAAQANHPLHRAWEQLTASMVSYFGSQYSFPHWTHETLTTVMKLITNSDSGEYKRMQKHLLSEMFLPMIVRMRYRYNHYFPDRKKLFNDIEYGGNEKSYYGYELCDTGLPSDFKYSTRLHKQIEQESNMMHLERFGEYTPSHQWKVVDSADKFQVFILSVMKDTIEHIKTSSKSVYSDQEWDQFAAKFSSKVETERFTKLMIEKILGPSRSQRKKLKKNEYTMASLPWRYKWGGDPDAVLKTYFNFKELPSEQLKFSGSPKEVLAWHLNYLKGQPENIKNQLSEPYAGLTQAGSPCHSFLFRPFEPSIKKACESELSTNDFISVNVEAPGLEVGNSIVSKEARSEIIDYIALNMWVTRESGKHDLDRQELTEESKLIFDVKIREGDISTMSVSEFRDFVFKSLISSRAADIKIGKRYRHWEQHFKTVLKNKITQVLPNAAEDSKIPTSAAISIIDFARNRKDTLLLSESSTRKFLLQSRRIPPNLTVPEFRTALLDLAASIREEEKGCKDNHWLGIVKTAVDNRLYKTLPDDLKSKMVNSAIILHDTNWMDGIHDLHFAFVVNPSTSKIEMAEYNPDTKGIRFFSQSSWFPKKKNAGWQLPDNYRAFAGEPMFNAEKFLNIN